MIITINYNSQDDYKDDDDGDDDEEEEDKDACVESSCSLKEVPEPSVAGPLMLLLVKSTMAVIAVMSVVVEIMMLITMMMTRVMVLTLMMLIMTRGLRRMTIA